jgi:hypothetical protein
MRDLVVLFLHLIVSIVRLIRPGGARRVADHLERRQVKLVVQHGNSTAGIIGSSVPWTEWICLPQKFRSLYGAASVQIDPLEAVKKLVAVRKPVSEQPRLVTAGLVHVTI